jgi:hypothetical protein
LSATGRVEGDYVIEDSVKAKAGCHSAVYLDGLEDAASTKSRLTALAR